MRMKCGIADTLHSTPHWKRFTVELFSLAGRPLVKSASATAGCGDSRRGDYRISAALSCVGKVAETPSCAADPFPDRPVQRCADRGRLARRSAQMIMSPPLREVMPACARCCAGEKVCCAVAAGGAYRTFRHHVNRRRRSPGLVRRSTRYEFLLLKTPLLAVAEAYRASN